MIANMTMANSTNNPIWSKGAIARMIDFNTTCRPGEVNKMYRNYSLESK
jgi:hypothetical protein